MPDQRSRSQFSLPLWLLIGVGLMLILPSLWGTPTREQLSYSDFKTMLRQGRIAQVQIAAHTLHLAAYGRQQKCATAALYHRAR
jgi:FtsH Extracellular